MANLTRLLFSVGRRALSLVSDDGGQRHLKVSRVAHRVGLKTEDTRFLMRLVMKKSSRASRTDLMRMCAEPDGLVATPTTQEPVVRCRLWKG